MPLPCHNKIRLGSHCGSRSRAECVRQGIHWIDGWIDGPRQTAAGSSCNLVSTWTLSVSFITDVHQWIVTLTMVECPYIAIYTNHTAPYMDRWPFVNMALISVCSGYLHFSLCLSGQYTWISALMSTYLGCFCFDFLLLDTILWSFLLSTHNPCIWKMQQMHISQSPWLWWLQ